MTTDEMIARIELLGGSIKGTWHWDSHRLILEHGSGLGHTGWNATYGSYAASAMGASMEEALYKLLEQMESEFAKFAAMNEHHHNRIQDILRKKP